MNLLLASLRRVEIRIEPQTITEFLKWKNRMQQYNGGAWPTGMEPTAARAKLFFGHAATRQNHHKPRRDGCPQMSGQAKLDAEAASAVKFERSVGCQSRSPHKKTGLVGPVSKWRRVEIGLHHDAARTGNKIPRVSLTRRCHRVLVPGENSTETGGTCPT